MVAVCFATNEIYPVHPGGVGRLMYNFAVNNLEAPTPVDLHYLLPAEVRAHEDVIRQTYADLATIHFCSADLASLGEFGERLRQLAETGDPDLPRSSNINEHLIKSLKYYSGLLEAQAAFGAEFDIIEFLDFGGWAAATQAAKAAGLAFSTSTISVRLHSTFGLICAAERYYHRPSLWLSTIWDMERKSLADADIVVGHLGSIADHNARAYGFSPQWRSRVITEFPPITIDQPSRALASPRPAQDFIFSSRLQPFKCPDIFVRAAVRMLREDPDCQSLFRVASYGWDEAYIDWLRSLVPVDLRLRIRFLPALTQDERAQLLRRSIVVVPSIYESLCLFAYESGMMGLKVIVNRECAAFGQGPRWNDANCLMFDGTYVDLARVMKAALTWSPAARVDATPDAPYWETFTPPSPPAAGGATRPTLATISYGFTSLADLNHHLMFAAEGLSGAQASDRLRHAIVPRAFLEEAGAPTGRPEKAGVALHPVDGWRVTADDIAAVLGQTSAEVVAFAPTDMRVAPAFIETALDALAADPDLSAVTSHTLTVVEGLEGEPSRTRLYTGDLLTAAVATTRPCHRASVFRREAIQRVGLKLDAGDRWFEDLCGRMVDAGCKILCLPAAPVREFATRPHSRISDELYFSTRATDLGMSLNLPYPLGSLSHTLEGDFRKGEAPAPDLRTLIPSGVKTWPHANFAKSELTASKGGDRDRYRDVKVRVTDLRIRNRDWDKVQFKLAILNHLPEIVFREQEHNIFEAWPPERSDQFGPMIEYCPRSHEAKGQPVAEALLRMPMDDRYRLGSLMRALPAIIQAAEDAKGIDRAVWVNAADTLLASWKSDGWE